MNYELSQGPHRTAAEGRCAMEWVAYIAGEEHSDSPACVSPVLRHFGMALNDYMSDEWRQKLRPYLARMIGTAGDGLDQERLYVLADWAVRTIAPIDLEGRGRVGDADRLRALPPVVGAASAASAASAAMRAVEAEWAWAPVRAAETAAKAVRAAEAETAAEAEWAAEAAARIALATATTVWATEAEVWRSALGVLDKLLPTELIDFPTEVNVRATEVCYA